MYKLFLIGCLLSVTKFAFSQGSVTRFSGNLLFGGAFPVGKFADKSPNPAGREKSAGWASPGIAMQLNLRIKINGSVGALLTVSGQQNKQRAESISDNLKQSGYYPPAAIFDMHSESWKIGKILLGGYYSVPLSQDKKWSLEGNATAGILKTSIPGYSYTYADGNSRVAGSMVKQNLPLSFCYQVGAFVNWKFEKSIHAVVGLNYAYAAPVYKYRLYTDFPSNTTYVDYKTKFPLGTIGLVAGIGLDF